MIRLIQENKNTPDHFNENFAERFKHAPDSQDMRRWKRLLKYYKGQSLLDMGTLDSQLPIMAKKKYSGADIWGLDYSTEAVNQMQKAHPEINYVQGDVYKTAFSAEQFGYVVMGEILEHLDRPDKAIKEAYRLLKVGGILAVSVPLDEYKEPGAVDGHFHVYSFNKEDIEVLLSTYGELKKIQVLRSEYVPVYKYHWPTLLAFAVKK